MPIDADPLESSHDNTEFAATVAATPSDRPTLKILLPMPEDADPLNYSGVTLPLDFSRNDTAQAATAAATPLDQLSWKDRLKALVIDRVNALPEEARRVRNRTRTGEEVAEAIPYPKIFLAEVDQMNEGKLLGFNDRGQLVMVDGCKETPNLDETFDEAQVRQSRLVYIDDSDQVKVFANALFTRNVVTRAYFLPNGEELPASSVLMERGLLDIGYSQKDGKHTGEYAQMNPTGEFDKETLTWVKDVRMVSDPRKAWAAKWSSSVGCVDRREVARRERYRNLGSRGKLLVNLAFSD